MLISLTVKNIALVEQACIEFGPGLNVVTGETGAGKSVLLGALKLLLGERADKNMIRSGEDTCSAQATFDLNNAEAINAMLEGQGVDTCEDGQLIIRRVVKASGSGQNFVNDCAVTLATMKKLGPLLVDMHGPYDHQSLLDPDMQLEILDAFGDLEKDKVAYETHYQALRDIEQQRKELSGNTEGVQEQLDLHSYRVSEIDAADLKSGEEEGLLEEHKVIGNAYRILELAEEILQRMHEGEPSAFEMLAGAQQPMQELTRFLPEAGNWLEELKGATTQIQELAGTVRGAVDDIDADPNRLEWLDERIATYSRLKKKYGGSVESVLETLATSQQRIHTLQTRDEQLATLDTEEAKIRKKLEAAADKLSKKRCKVAAELAGQITGHLHDLGFEHGEFAVELSPCAPKRSGMDDVDYGFAPNKGETMRPLKSIASSGEISRVMLAVKGVLAKFHRIPLMVFDEIDSNVGGEMGNAIGQKMYEVAQHHQIVTITHLPQVAVYGNQHFAVAKSIKGDRTVTEVQPLDDQRRAEEIARMLGGIDRTKVTLQHAREMLGITK